MVIGCNRTSNIRGASQEKLNATDRPSICPRYCINVLRGCFAASLLFLPIQVKEKVHVFEWNVLLADGKLDGSIDAIRQSMNASTLVDMIQNGLDKVKRDFSIIKYGVSNKQL